MTEIKTNQEQIKIIAARLKRMIDVGPIPILFWTDLDTLLNLILKEDEENNDKRSVEAIEETKSVVREKKVKAPSSPSNNFIN
jgi:hypothetical protein